MHTRGGQAQQSSHHQHRRSTAAAIIYITKLNMKLVVICNHYIHGEQPNANSHTAVTLPMAGPKSVTKSKRPVVLKDCSKTVQRIIG